MNIVKDYPKFWYNVSLKHMSVLYDKTNDKATSRGSEDQKTIRVWA